MGSKTVFSWLFQIGLWLILGLGTALEALAQINGDYRSRQTGNWHTVTTWQVFNAGGFQNLEDPGAGAFQNVIPTSASGAIEIQSAHIVTVAANVTVDQLTVSNGAQLILSSGVQLILANGVGNDLTLGPSAVVQVAGTLVGNNGFSHAGTSTTNLFFLAGGTYRHLYTTTEGIIPLATWNAASNLVLAGYTTNISASVAGNWGQTFGNVEVNVGLSYGAALNMNGLLTNMAGSFFLTRTGSINSTSSFLFSSNQTAVITIADSVNILNNARFLLTQTGNVTLNVGRTFRYTSTNNKGSFLTQSGIAHATVSGNLVFGATDALLYTSGANGTATIRVFGTVQQLGGQFTKTGINSVTTIRFSGPSSRLLTNFVLGGGADYVVENGAQFDTGEFFVSTSGNFTMEANSTLRVGSTEPTGAIGATDATGSLRINPSKRFFNATCRVIYRNLANPQFMGPGNPQTANAITEIENPNNVSVVGNVTLVGALELDGGNLIVGANTLTLRSPVTTTSNFIQLSAASSLVINSSGAFGTLPVNSNAIIGTLTLNRTGGAVITPNQNLTVATSLQLQNGDLDINGRTLVLDGTLTRTNGRIVANTSTTLVVNGSGTLGSNLLIAPPAQLGTLRINRSSGTVGLSGAITITNLLDLQQGTLNNTPATTLVMANNATIQRSGATLANRPTNAGSDTYNVTYNPTGSLITGLELPDPTNAVDLFMLTTQSGTVTLGQNVTVNGNVNLSGGSFGTGTFTLTMRGANWNDDAGTFVPGAGSVIFDGATTIGGSSTPLLGNFSINVGRTLTQGSSNLEWQGTTITLSGTFQSGSGTVLLTGASPCLLSAGNNLFNDIEVNKSGGAVSITAVLRLQGMMTISSATVVDSGPGLLTLVSTNDQPTADGSIGPITGGGSVIGEVTIQRFMSAGDDINRYMSAPTKTARVVDWQDDFPITGSFVGSSTCSGCSGNSLRYYREQTTGAFNRGFTSYPPTSNTQPILNGRGYLAYMWEGGSPITWDMTGEINSGSFSFADSALLTYTPSSPARPNDDGWNLLGNPYPSSIEWNLTDWTKSNVTDFVYVTDMVSNVTRFWNAASNSGDLLNGVIATGQAFWVKATGASPTLVLTENAKVRSGSGNFYRKSTDRPSAFPLTVSLSNGVYEDRSYVSLLPTSTSAYDELTDALKFISAGYGVSIVTPDQVDLALNVVPHWPDQIPLRVTVQKAGTYRLMVEADDQELLEAHEFVDLETGYSASLGEQVSYPIHVTAETILNDRFYIARRGTLRPSEEMMISVFPNPVADQLMIQAEGSKSMDVSLFNQQGKTLRAWHQENCEQGPLRFDVSSLPPGVYYVLVRSASGRTKTTKLIKS